MVSNLYRINIILFVCCILVLVANMKKNNKSHEFPIETNKHQIETDFSRGFTALLNCGYFRRMYPKERKKLISHTEVYFGYEDAPYMKELYAISDITQNTILLGDNYFKEANPNQREGIMAHEMMHLIGMPPHKYDNMTTVRRKTDVIYVTEHACFHRGESWEYF